jgi:hypothetical protein
MSDATFMISGAAQVGEVLSALPNYYYQWYRSGAIIPGEILPTYRVRDIDVGQIITVTRTMASMPSAPVAGIPSGGGVPVNTAIPIISGVAKVGSTLTASDGSWTNSPSSFTYQWANTGAIIKTASTYIPVAADIGNLLTVTIVAANASGPSSPAISLATSAIAAASGGVSSGLDFSQPSNSALISALAA